MNKYTVFLVLSVFALVGLSGCAGKKLVNPSSLTPAVSGSETTKPTEAETKERAKSQALQVEETVAADAYGQHPAEEKDRQGASELISALQVVYFNYDSANLGLEARQALDVNFQLLAKDNQARVRIEGHCDERGSDEYNLALGEIRANAAMKYLVSLGIDDQRISTVSYGKEKPVVAGDDEAAWAKNRRAAFVPE